MKLHKSLRRIQIISQSLNCGNIGLTFPQTLLSLPVPLPKRLLRLFPLLLGPVHRLPVMRREHHKADHLAGHALLQQVAHRKEVAQTLGHLLALHLQHLVVHPEPRHFLCAIGTAALGDLVFMVRELQVQPATVNIKHIAQKRLRHGRAFNMPARTATPPRAVPPGLILA